MTCAWYWTNCTSNNVSDTNTKKIFTILHKFCITSQFIISKGLRAASTCSLPSHEIVGYFLYNTWEYIQVIFLWTRSHAMRHKTKMPFNHSTISLLLILHMEHRSIDNWSIEVQHRNRTIPKNTQEHLTFLALQSILQFILQSSLSHTYHDENMSISYEPCKTNSTPRLISLALLKQLFIWTIHIRIYTLN